MPTKYNLAEIESRYRHYYQEAILRGRYTLPYYEIEQWDKVLTPVESRIFQDIREMGIALYPVFPVAEKTYLHFANPFVRVGIEIEYKNSPKTTINRKLQLLKPQRWTVYVITSQKCYHTFEEFFNIKRKDPAMQWGDLSQDLQLKFFQKYRLENCACLLNYIQAFHFQGQLV
jgi:hypothetical protein